MNRNFTLWALPCLKRFSLAFLATLVSIITWAQVIGDYRSNVTTTGNWSTLATWQRYNGSLWVAATTYPGQNAGTGTVTIQGGQSVTLNVSPANGIAALQLALGSNANSTLTFNSGTTLVVNGIVTLGAGGNNRRGFLVMSNGGTLRTAGFSVGNANSLLTPGSGTTGGTIELTAANTLPAVTAEATPSATNAFANFNNLTIVTGTTTTGRSINVAGKLTVNSGATFSPDALHVINGTGSLAGTGTIKVTGLGATNSLFTQYPIYAGNVPAVEGLSVDYAGAGSQTVNALSYGNLKTSGSGTKTVGGTGALKVSGNLTVSNGTTLDVGGYAAENLSQGTGTTLLIEDGAVLRVGGGNLLPTNFQFYDLKPTSTVDFYGAVHSILARKYGNLTLTGTTTVTATGVLEIVGNLTIGPGATFNASNDGVNNVLTHSIKGNWINNGIFEASTSKFIFDGTADQTIGGNNISTFYNFEINKTSTVTLNKLTSIARTLTFSNGVINTSGTNLLSFNDGDGNYAAVAGVSNASFVNGPVQKIGNENFVFPVGQIGAGYHPIEMSTPQDPRSSSTYTAEYIRASASALDPSIQAGDELRAVSNCEYWDLEKIAGSDVKVTLFWNANSGCGQSAYIINPQVLVVAHLKNSAWHSHGGDVPFESSGEKGSVTSVGFVSDFSPFTIGTTNATQAPLPVTYISFEGRKAGNGTQLTWKVGGEKDVAGYEIERKTTGSGFVKIGYVSATGSSSYTFTDGSTQKGIVSYRLKNVDTDGRSAFSKVVSVKNETGVVVFPTVTAGRTTILHDAAAAGATVTLSTADGKQVKVQRPAAGSVQTVVDLSTLRSGTYLVQYNSGTGFVQTTKVVKQ